MLSIKNTEVCL